MSWSTSNPMPMESLWHKQGHELQNPNSIFSFFQLKAEVVLSSSGKSQLLLELFVERGPQSVTCRILGVRVSGQLLQGLGSAWGSRCQNPPAESLGMQSKGIRISTQSQLAPRVLHRELRVGVRAL